MTQELPRSLDPITDVLARIGKKGVKLWAANGQLHYRAISGLLTDDEIGALRFHKNEIVVMLERATDVTLMAPDAAVTENPEFVTLSFSQEAHWHRYKLYGRGVPRTIASATRMTGRVDLNILRDSITYVVRRHPSLRTRIVVLNGTPMQRVSESADFKFEIQDLTALSPSAREVEVKLLIEGLILEPIDVSEGPLWEARLLTLHNEEHVLIVVMEHIISDMRSLQILLRDVFLIYTQLSRGHRVSLPAIPMQFSEYIEWQRKVCDSTIGRSSYASTRLSTCPRVRFPDDRALLKDSHRGWDCMRIKITSQQRANLSTWSGLRKATPSMAVFTAYVALVLRWCNVSDIVILFTIDGRTSDKIQDAIGYFARLLPIRIELYRSDSFVSLLKRVTLEYCRAYEQADFYHLDAQVPVPDFASNSGFNWIVQNNADPAGADVTEEFIKCSPIHFEPPISETIEFDTEPAIALSDLGSEVSGGIYFPKSRFSVARMQRFAANFGLFIEELLENPNEPIYEITLI